MPPAAATVRFCEELGAALHRYGAPAHQIEASLENVAARLGLAGRFFATPTAILASFELPGAADGPLEGAPAGHTFMVRVDPGEVDLGKLTRLVAILDDLFAGDLDLAAARQEVRRIAAAPAPYGPALTTVCFALASAGATRFFGGGSKEIAVAFVIGLVIAALAAIVARHRAAARLLEVVAALIAALVAASAAWLIGPLSTYVAMLGGLIVLVPGLTLTIAMNELATRNLVAGTARLVGAIMTFVGLGFGVALGSRLAVLALGRPPVAEPLALPAWSLGVALIVVPLALAVLFRARPRDAGWILASGALGFGGARLGSALLGPELAAFVGAAVVGVASNGYSRLLNRPASVPMVPGIMLLVPGSVGFRSVTALLEQDVVSGMETAFTMTLVAVALVTGLLVANVILPARKAL